VQDAARDADFSFIGGILTMTRLRWVVISSLFALAVAGTALAAKEASEKKGKAGADKPSGLPPGATLNACGCYKKGDACVCTNKKAKCECPGDCEPAGCAKKHDEEAAKEYSDAVKQAQEAEKKREEAEKQKIQDEEKKRQAAEAALEKKRAEKEGAGEETAAAPADEEEKPAAKAKKSTKKK